MLRRHALLASLAALSVLAAPAMAGPRPGAHRTALDRYVAKPDPTYSYKVAETRQVDGATVSVIDMVSQTWRKPSEVNRTKWEHWLTIVRPTEAHGPIGFLFITGGSNPSQPPATDPFLMMLAKRTKTVVAELKMVPNEPLTFAGESIQRSEDAIIAYSWDKFLKTGDEEWPLRLPMTKSAVRAMDTITDFCKKPEGGGVAVGKFVVSGGSKRGWTTWTTAAVDDRVVAIAPMVIDVLNVKASMDHHFQAYGFWAPAVQDYTAMKLQSQGGSDRYKALMDIEDPYSYRDRLTIPKLIINSTGDQYFLPDSWQFYWGDLKGEKTLAYVPNTKHNLSGGDAARETLAAFYADIVNNKPRPKFTWSVQKDGSIRVETKDKPSEVKLWQATNPKARDFRLDIIGPAYVSAPLQPVKEGVYVAKVPAPAQGWTAFLVQLTYPSESGVSYKVTTGVHVVPDTLPFPLPKPEAAAK